jgi:hypothetical protein
MQSLSSWSELIKSQIIKRPNFFDYRSEIMRLQIRFWGGGCASSVLFRSAAFRRTGLRAAAFPFAPESPAADGLLFSGNSTHPH